ncbi:helix-turn-helix domain-containing protein [Mycolicibacterium confluentis]|nr:helix-turn-helix domain-containing protein [Mycolicibacterium confluentis]
MSVNPTNSRFLSTVEAAAYIGVSTNTLRSYVHKKIVPAHRVGPRLLKFDPAELDEVVKGMGR